MPDPQPTEWFESLPVNDTRPATSRWSQWDTMLVIVLAATLAAAMVFLFLPLLRQRQAMHAQLQKLEKEFQAQEERSRQLLREIDALQTDAAYVERVARDKLNLVAPGETLFQFEPHTATPAPPHSTR